MTPTKLLVGQIIIVFVIAILGVWASTQWTAKLLGYQMELGKPWFWFGGEPIYHPRSVFIWWYQFDAHAPEVLDKAGMLPNGVARAVEISSAC